MHRKPSTATLKPKQLKSLFNIAAEATMSSRNPQEIKAEILQDYLRQTLPVYRESCSRHRTKAQSNVRNVIESLSGESVGRLLRDAETPIELIKDIKARSKTLSKSAQSEAEYQAANTVYYAAIASALLFHDLRITQFAYGDLHDSFVLLSEQVWVPDYLRELFMEAAKICQNKR
jgi:hypothetical protein